MARTKLKVKGLLSPFLKTVSKILVPGLPRIFLTESLSVNPFVEASSNFMMRSPLFNPAL